WEEVVAVALVEPDFVDASQIREEPPRQGRSSVNIDHGRISKPVGRRPVAAEHDLIIRADGHALWEVTVVVRNREVRHDLRVSRQAGLRINPRNPPAGPIAGHWTVLIKLSCLPTPPTLLETAGGLHGTICTVEYQPPVGDHFMGFGRDERDEGAS